MRALIIAWSSTIGLLLIIFAWLSFTYEPEQYAQTTAQPSAQVEATTSYDEPVEEDLSTEQLDEQVTAPDTTAPEENLAINGAVLGDNITRPDFGNDTPDVAQNSVSDIVEQEQAQEPFAFINPVNTALLEDGPYGPIPVVNNQEQPWQVYSRPFDRPGDRPRISIIIVGMGLSESATQNSINMLPPDISLAFSPYGQNMERWTEEARQNGHETLLMVPMEPLDFPINDPGPHTLINTLPASDNLDRLYYVLSRMQGYVGVVNDMGSKFTADPDAIAPIMQDLQRRGLIFVDARTSRLTVAATSAREFGVPRAQNDRYIDNDVSAAQIDRYLRELENIALRSGNAVGIARPYPITIERLVLWAADLRMRGIELAPITAMSNRQTLR
ncbi:MAG: divergent polysaccharide deacetylase family protein [Sphingomonadales bacterium]|nr:divergent polysaccharide deacetylase family protein [Sphingomonadales bacterium]